MSKKDEQIDELVESISALVGALEKGFACKQGHGEPATKHDLFELEKRIMSQISTILDPIAAQLTQATTDIAAIAAALTTGGTGSISPADVTELTSVATGVATLAATLHTLALSLVTPSTITAIASAAPLTGPAPLAVQFSTTGSVDSTTPTPLPLTFSTDFGDKSPVDTTAAPAHTYAAPGTYSAVTTVSNGKTSVAAAPISIVVS